MGPSTDTLFNRGSTYRAFSDEQARDYDMIKAAMLDEVGPVHRKVLPEM